MFYVFLFLFRCLFITFLFLVIRNFSFFYVFFPTKDIIFIFFILTVFWIFSIKYIKNPIYILLSIVFGFVLLSFLLFNQKSELLIYTFINFYLGVLILIVLVLTRQDIKKKNETNNEYFLFILLFISFFAFILKFVIFTMPNAIILQELTFILCQWVMKSISVPALIDEIILTSCVCFLILVFAACVKK